MLLGAYASFVCVVLYDAGDLAEFVAGLKAEPGLLMSAAALLAVELVDAGRYAIVVRGGFMPPPKSLQLTFMQVMVLLFPAALLNGVDAPPSVAGWTMLIAMLLAILFFEGLPTIARESLATGKGLTGRLAGRLYSWHGSLACWRTQTSMCDMRSRWPAAPGR